MLARRFTIVCLLIALFGMALSIVVAQSGRRHFERELRGLAPYSWEISSHDTWQTG